MRSGAQLQNPPAPLGRGSECVNDIPPPDAPCRIAGTASSSFRRSTPGRCCPCRTCDAHGGRRWPWLAAALPRALPVHTHTRHTPAASRGETHIMNCTTLNSWKGSNPVLSVMFRSYLWGARRGWMDGAHRGVRRTACGADMRGGCHSHQLELLPIDAAIQVLVHFPDHVLQIGL